ncbi:MAG: glycosyltransferase [Bacteroidales bacterium]|nr:glycosyltransferase [Bacteroidales bacterium]
MRIFVLLSRIPWPLEKGDKLRAYHQIRCLSQKNEIILCALNTDRKADKQRAFKALQPYCRSINFIDLPATGKAINLIRAMAEGRPLQSGYFYNRSANRKINTLINEYKPDMLYGQLLRVAEYIRYHKLPKALDYQDVFSVGMQRRVEVSPWYLKPFLRLEFSRLTRYESEVFSDFDLKCIISKPDRDLIAHPDREQIMIVANGVDHDFFKPLIKEKKFDVVFTGNMAYPPNVNAAEFLVREIMPKVWNKYPQTKVLLAGATPDQRVRNLASDRVSVSGWLDDIREAYATSKIFIAPMRIGTGLQNKLLEAMSMKLPCITTPLANNALEGRHGDNLLLGNSADELATNILHLMQDDIDAGRIADNGYNFVHQHYNWEQATEKFMQKFQEIVNQQ